MYNYIIFCTCIIGVCVNIIIIILILRASDTYISSVIIGTLEWLFHFLQVKQRSEVWGTQRDRHELLRITLIARITSITRITLIAHIARITLIAHNVHYAQRTRKTRTRITRITRTRTSKLSSFNRYRTTVTSFVTAHVITCGRYVDIYMHSVASCIPLFPTLHVCH